MLMDSLVLATRWKELLTLASAVDIAVAWITSAERTNDLLVFAGLPSRQVRVIAGVGDNLTSPACLRRLHGVGVVKIGVREHGGTFHPKLYLFTLPDRQVCWVGSANLTTSGFGGNTELVHEYSDDGTAAAWFVREWDSCE